MRSHTVNISNKTVDFLLERFYRRRFLSSIINNIPQPVFTASVGQALKMNDESYVGIMSNIEEYSKEYSIYIDVITDLPLIIKNKDLTIEELAALYVNTKSKISIEYYYEVIGSVCSHSLDQDISEESLLKEFKDCANFIEKLKANVIHDKK